MTTCRASSSLPRLRSASARSTYWRLAGSRASAAESERMSSATRASEQLREVVRRFLRARHGLAVRGRRLLGGKALPLRELLAGFEEPPAGGERQAEPPVR